MGVWAMPGSSWQVKREKEVLSTEPSTKLAIGMRRPKGMSGYVWAMSRFATEGPGLRG